MTNPRNNKQAAHHIARLSLGTLPLLRPRGTAMKSPTQLADEILITILLQDAQLRAAGLTEDQRFEAMLPGLTAILQREAVAQRLEGYEQAKALAVALNMLKGGKVDQP